MDAGVRPCKTGIEEQSLTAEDQLFILMQAGLYLTATRGFAAPEARICYERAEPLCHSLDRPVVLYSALMGQWRYSLLTDKLTATMQIAERVYALAQEQNDPALLIGAFRMLAVTLYFSGDFAASRKYAKRGVELWRRGGTQSRSKRSTPQPWSVSVLRRYASGISARSPLVKLRWLKPFRSRKS